MSRGWVLALALFHPEDVDDLDVDVSGGAVRITWSLPSDPSVTGLTIFRDNLENGDTTVFQIVGLTTDFVDAGTDPDDDYRYWIHTRDAQGDLSSGVYVEVFTHDDDDDDHGSWYCSFGSVRAGLPPALGILGGLLLLALRRGR